MLSIIKSWLDDTTLVHNQDETLMARKGTCFQQMTSKFTKKLKVGVNFTLIGHNTHLSMNKKILLLLTSFFKSNWIFRRFGYTLLNHHQGSLVTKSTTEREKGRDPTQSYDKSPYTDRKIKKNPMWQHKNATKNFDYTTIADWLKTVSLGNDSHPTGVVKPVYGIPTFPLTANAV